MTSSQHPTRAQSILVLMAVIAASYLPFAVLGILLGALWLALIVALCALTFAAFACLLLLSGIPNRRTDELAPMPHIVILDERYANAVRQEWQL